METKKVKNTFIRERCSRKQFSRCLFVVRTQPQGKSSMKMRKTIKEDIFQMVGCQWVDSFLAKYTVTCFVLCSTFRNFAEDIGKKPGIK